MRIPYVGWRDGSLAKNTCYSRTQVWLPAPIKLFLLLLHSYDFAAVKNHNKKYPICRISDCYTCERVLHNPPEGGGQDPQVEKHCLNVKGIMQYLSFCSRFVLLSNCDSGEHGCADSSENLLLLILVVPPELKLLDWLYHSYFSLVLVLFYNLTLGMQEFWLLSIYYCIFYLDYNFSKSFIMFFNFCTSAFLQQYHVEL